MDQIDKFADLFKLLGDKNGLSIVSVVQERELCVCELVELVEMSQPKMSQQLTPVNCN